MSLLESYKWQYDTISTGMNSLFTQHVWFNHIINFRDKLPLIKADSDQKGLQVWSYTKAWPFRRLYQRGQSTCRLTGETPVPVEKEEKISQCTYFLFFKRQTNFLHQPEKYRLINSWRYCMYLGPGGGTLPALSSSIMLSMSLGKRSSWKQEETG